MNNHVAKLWNRNFITFVIGMELSLISNSLLRFVLPLYILINTGDPAIMGMVLTLCHLPYIVLGPIGGVAADRLNKRKILAMMNFISGLVIIPYLFITRLFYVIPSSIILLFVISVIESIMSPSSGASMPVLVPKDALVKANSLSFVLSTSSVIGAPIVGGFIMERFGVTPIIIISAVSFIMAAFVKSITKIPFTKQKMEHGAVKAVFVDLKDALAYILRENPYLSKIIILNTIGSIILTPMISIGLPVFVSTYLGRGESVLGLLQGIIVFGGTLGVIALQLIGEKATVKLVRPIIFISLFILVSTGVVFVLSTHDNLRFFYLIGSFFSITALTTILETIIFADVGQKTSEFMVKLWRLWCHF